MAEGTVINAMDPFHPAYGIPITTRARAVSLAETKGVKAAAAMCNVALSTVYRWVSAYAGSSNTK